MLIKNRQHNVTGVRINVFVFIQVNIAYLKILKYLYKFITLWKRYGLPLISVAVLGTKRKWKKSYFSNRYPSANFNYVQLEQKIIK